MRRLWLCPVEGSGPCQGEPWSCDRVHTRGAGPCHLALILRLPLIGSWPRVPFDMSGLGRLYGPPSAPVLVLGQFDIGYFEWQMGRPLQAVAPKLRRRLASGWIWFVRHFGRTGGQEERRSREFLSGLVSVPSISLVASGRLACSSFCNQSRPLSSVNAASCLWPSIRGGGRVLLL